jgi:hypothetical protein
MQILYPSMLWGLLALAVPVIIHLFNFRRTKKVYFTNVAFLKKVETETSSFRRLKQWLILLSRLLFIASLVLAFAQPFIPSKNGGDSNETARGTNGLYLDNSLSMSNTTDNKRFIDLAVIKIDELLSLFKNQKNIQLTSNDFSGEDQFANSASKVKDRLTDVRFSSKGRTLSAVYNRQSSMADKERSGNGNNFFWFSDFQKSTVGNLANLTFDSTDNIYLVPVQGEVSRNIFVDSVWLSSPFVREMQNAVLYVKVFNSGNQAVEKMPVKLFIDGVQTSTSSVSVSPDTYSTTSFNFTVRNKGVHKGSISFEDQPITFDNEHYFVLNVSPPVNILHLYDQRSSLDYLAKLYDNDSLFNFTQFSIRNFNLERLSAANLVIIEGAKFIEASVAEALSDFMSGGGNVFLIPGSSTDFPSYQNFLGNAGIRSFGLVNDSLATQYRIELEVPDRSQPFFDDVFEQSLSTKGILNLPSVQAVWTWSGIGEKLLSLKNGKSFLTKTSFKKGAIYLLGSPLDKNYGNFAEHALFVPTFFKVASMSMKPHKLFYNFNEGTLNIPFANAPKNAIYSLKNGDIQVLPTQRVRDNTLLLELPSSADLSDNQEMEAGFYDLQIDGKTQAVLGLNHDAEESRMGNYSPEELKTFFEGQLNVTVFENIRDNDFINSFAEQNFGKQLWKYFLYAALIFLLIEILLVRFVKV